jgi:hypothetical protein
VSVTGPGCAHCDRGRVTTPDGDKPCDRCGGWSQFAATPPPDYDARHMRLMRERDTALHRAETAEGLLATVLAAIRREHNARAAWLATLPDGSCGNPPSQALLDAEATTREALRRAT